MFHLLPLLYSFMKTYVTTFFHSVYAKRLEKTLKFFFHAYQVGVTLRYVTTFFHPVYAKRLEKTFKFFFHAYQVGSCFSARSPKT